DPQAYIEERLQRVVNGDRTRDIHELPDGRIVAVEHRPLPDGGWLTTHDDITELRRYEEEVAYFAAHDTVTGVMNRRSFEDRVCEHHLTAGGAKYAVLCVNVDNFKTANQLLGHAGGDRLLRAIAERLQECVSEGDVVSRLGSDNFVILQVADDQPNQARVLAHYICEVMQEPFEVDGNSLTSGVSVGIAIAPCDGTEPGTLITHADLALRLAKREGRGCYRFFEAEMDARMRQRRQLENDLRDALSKGELELFYQPVINAQSEEISGCEALLRWNHPEHGPISPAEFIPLAEEVGVIVPVGEWILREACREAANWPSHMRIAVNVSAAQFRSGNLVASVVSALAASGLDPIQLELEITETVLLQDCQSTLDTLHMLRNLGVRIAMDDFGTGYSSLSYLRSFPFDKIKLDGSFVYDLAKGNGSTAIIRAVSSLGRSLGVTTTAEGVETREQFDIIRSEGYSEVQGYYFSRPVPAEELHAMYFPERPRAVSAA
ncbi:MAG: EAL domain-containing protein, partial [Alphaproteobacteria bacterium]